MPTLARCLTLVLCALSLPAASLAGVVYQTRTSSNCGTLNEVTSSTTPGSPASLSRSVSGDGCTADLTGIAGDGFLGVRGVTRAVANDEPRSFSGDATIRTSARFSDVSITLPATYAGGDITAAIAFSLDGSISASVADGFNFALAQSSIEASVLVSPSGGAGPPIVVFSREIFVNDVIGDGIPPADGITFSGTLITDTFTFDPTLPMTISMFLDGFALSTASQSTIADASVVALNSLTFREQEPFILPDGFSVTYPDANLFDNTWVDPRTVPEPGLGWLPALLFPLVWRGRRGARR